MTTSVQAILGDDIARLLGAGRLATAVSFLCFLGFVFAGVMLVRASVDVRTMNPPSGPVVSSNP